MSTTPPPSLPAKPRGDLRTLGPWYAAIMLNSYAGTLYTAGCYDFADKVLNASAPTRLWVSACWGLAYIFISIMAGKLTEKWGPKRTLYLMIPLCILATIGGLAMLCVPHGWRWAPWILAAVMLPFNITNSACWPALETAISRCPARLRLSSRTTFYNLAWSITGFAAIFTRGALEEAWWGFVFVASAAAMVLSLITLWRFACPDSMLTQENVPEESGGETELDTPALRQRAVTLLHMAWIGNALAYVAINSMLPVLMTLAQYARVTDLAVAGFITSVWGFTRVAGFIAVMKWTGWHYKARWLVGTQLALALSFLLMLMIHDPWTLILTQAVFGLSTALIYSSSLYYAMHTSEGSGGHAGLHEALIGVGICIGPAIGALAGGASVGLEALQRIGWSVTGLLLLGTLAMAMMGMRKSTTLGKISTNVHG